MKNAIQIKLLVAILSLLAIIAGLIARGGRPSYVLTPQDLDLQKKLEKQRIPSSKHYLVP